MAAIIRVGMAQFAIAKSPEIIETLALGSCVGIVLYDPSTKIGGMAHAMLPSITDAKETSRGNLAKFVNSAISELLNAMLKQGASKKFITAKMAGGANMFPDIKTSGLHIGERNSQAAQETLTKEKIPLVSEETGGNFGRTLSLDTETGDLKVKTIQRGERII